MRVVYNGVFDSRRQLFRDSLFQKRIEVEVVAVPAPSSEFRVSVSPEPERNDAACLALEQFAPSASGGEWAERGHVRLPRESYEVYPYDHENPAVQSVLHAVHELVVACA